MLGVVGATWRTPRWSLACALAGAAAAGRIIVYILLWQKNRSPPVTKGFGHSAAMPPWMVARALPTMDCDRRSLVAPALTEKDRSRRCGQFRPTVDGSRARFPESFSSLCSCIPLQQVISVK